MRDQATIAEHLRDALWHHLLECERMPGSHRAGIVTGIFIGLIWADESWVGNIDITASISTMGGIRAWS